MKAMSQSPHLPWELVKVILGRGGGGGGGFFIFPIFETFFFNFKRSLKDNRTKFQNSIL